MVFNKNLPQGTDKVNASDDYIRENWRALEEDIIGQQHTFSTGAHILGETSVLKVDTLANLATGTGVIGAISFASDTELLYRDTGSALSAITKEAFPSGTKMYFYQNTAPTGWTYSSGVTDAVLAVKGGSQAYNANGGTEAGTWTQPDHTLTTSEIPSHTHSQVCDSRGAGSNFYGAYSGAPAAFMYNPYNTGSAGGGNAHNHGTTYRPAAAIGIICEKD